MHKGVILLTKAQDAEQAQENVNEFLEPFGDGKVWDWYKIGGRWSSILSPFNKAFSEKSTQMFKEKYPNHDQNFITQEMVDDIKPELQSAWEELGGTGENPLARDNYGEPLDDDIMSLPLCLNIIKEWTQDMNVLAENFFERMVKEREDEKTSPGTMSAYYANRYAECKYDQFSFESNVFDIDNETNNPSQALETPSEYFAVVIDMHN